MSDLQDATAEELMQRMLTQEFFFIESTPLVPFEKLLPVLKEHLVYQIELEKEGVLFASGPLKDKAETMTGAGVTIIRAESFEAAETIARNDPFVQAGLREPTIHKWVMNEGRISVSVDLSDGTAQFN